MRRPHSLFLHHSSVHSGILAGIAGSKHEGCYSVVLSGGYEDDKDEVRVTSEEAEEVEDGTGGG